MNPLLIDKALEGPSLALGISHLPTLIWLFIVFLLFFILTLLLHIVQVRERQWNISTPMLISNIALFILGLATSLGTFHYSHLLIIAILLTPLTLSLVALHGRETPRIKILTLALAILVIAAMGSRFLIVGIQEEETTSDMINIWLNGYFRWSVHGGHYDLAPLDPILKVMLAHVTGRDIYDAAIAAAMYISYGIAPFLLLYTLVRTLTGRAALALPIVLLTMLSYPYSPLIGLSAPSAPHAHLLTVSALTLILRPLLGLGDLTNRRVIAASMLLTAATLMHPSTIVTSLFLTMITAILKIKNVDIKIIYILVLVITLIFIKIAYTAFVSGFTSYLVLLWNYIITAFTGRETLDFTTRNVGYSGLPRLGLVGFGAFFGFLAGLALPLFVKAARRQKLTPVELLFLATVFFYALFSAASLLSGIGGVSQSRILFNGAQPYVEVITAIYLATLVAAAKRWALLVPLALAVAFTLITPNAMPFNYSIPMAKLATINDHIIAYEFTGLIDKNFYITLYDSCGQQGRIVAMQVRGEATYGLGATQSLTYFFIAPRVIPARSYWDGCVMAVNAPPRDADRYIKNRVFDAWVYAFYLYRPA
jgi:hypothetical protein